MTNFILIASLLNWFSHTKLGAILQGILLVFVVYIVLKLTGWWVILLSFSIKAGLVLLGIWVLQRLYKRFC
jgi:hypothetical protein